MKRALLIIFLAGSVFLLFPAPETDAMEPVTIALLTPVAIELAKVMMPYVARYFSAMMPGILGVGMDMLNIFRLPLGFFEVIFLPFWYFRDGVEDLVRGALAPFELCLHMLLLPFEPLGRM